MDERFSKILNPIPRFQPQPPRPRRRTRQQVSTCIHVYTTPSDNWLSSYTEYVFSEIYLYCERREGSPTKTEDPLPMTDEMRKELQLGGVGEGGAGDSKSRPASPGGESLGDSEHEG